MSIDYNEKFKELRKKISNLSEINSEFSKNKIFYKNRLKQLELNSGQKLENISKKLNKLKNDFIKINSVFLKEANNSLNKNNSFYYPLIQKNEIDKKKLFIKNFTNQISEEISNNSKETQNNLYLKFYEMENLLKKIIEKKREDRKILKKEIMILAGEFRENFENFNEKVENNKIKEENILTNINENFKKEIYNTKVEIKEMQRKNEKYGTTCENKIKEMNEWITNNFRKEKRKREMFQENVMNILKETCQKLSDDFYRNNNMNNNEYEEDNENEINEEENIGIYQNDINKYNNNILNNESNNIEHEFIYNNKNNVINIEVNQNQKEENKNIYEENAHNKENNMINNENDNMINNEENNEMIDEQNYEEYNEEIENYIKANNYEEYEKYANEDINNENELYNEENDDEEENVEEINDNYNNENNNEELKGENKIKE